MPELHKVTIDGKQGWLAYFDENFQMVDPDRAVTAKVVFEDGSRVFYTVEAADGQPKDVHNNG